MDDKASGEYWERVKEQYKIKCPACDSPMPQIDCEKVTKCENCGKMWANEWDDNTDQNRLVEIQPGDDIFLDR